MSTNLGGFFLILFAFVLWLLYVHHRWVFHMWSVPGVRGMKPVWESHPYEVTAPINVSLPQFYVFQCICLLWDGSCGRWGRFPYPLNTVEAGAKRLVGFPKLELQGPPTLPRLLCSPPGRTLLQPVVAYEDRMKTNWHRWQMHTSLFKYKLTLSLFLFPTHTHAHTRTTRTYKVSIINKYKERNRLMLPCAAWGQHYAREHCHP